MKTKKSWFQEFSRRRAWLGLVMAGAVWLSLGVQRCAAQFPSSPGDEHTTSFGAFQIQVSPNFTNLFWPTTPTGYFYYGFDPNSGILTSPVGYDPATVIGISASQTFSAPGYPVTVGVGRHEFSDRQDRWCERLLRRAV